MSVKLHAKVSPSFNPGVVAHLDGYSDATKGLVAGVEKALKVAYEGIASVHDAWEAVRRDLSLTEAGRTMRVDDMAQRVFKSAAALFDAEHANLSKAIAHIEEKLNAPIEASVSHPIAREIRDYIRQMQESDRPGFIYNAITSGDLVTATSALAGPHYLTGLTPEGHEALRRKYHEKAAPEEAQRLKVMRGALKLVHERGPLLFSALENAVGAKPHEVRALREAKARADKALAGPV